VEFSFLGPPFGVQRQNIRERTWEFPALSVMAFYLPLFRFRSSNRIIQDFLLAYSGGVSSFTLSSFFAVWN
jgi:hypothetical protein